MISLTIPDIRNEDIEAVNEVLQSGNLVQGQVVENFEKSYAHYVNAKHAIAVSSGTAALHLSLVVHDIGPGDSVIVPAFSYVATANVVRLVGAEPIFVDIGIEDFCICADKLIEKIEEQKNVKNLKAIIPVHEFGAPAAMLRIQSIAKENNLLVIEDCACGLGSRINSQHVGTFGKCGCFSFHPRKSITTGEGGMIITNDDQIASKLRLLRSHGVIRKSFSRIDCVLPGFNYRMTDIQAALGLGQLKRFDSNLQIRKKLVMEYFNQLSGIDNYKLPKFIEGHSWQSLMLLYENDDLMKFIKKAFDSGVQLSQGAQCIPSNSAYLEHEIYPNAEKAEKSGFVVPLHNRMNEHEVSKVSKFVKKNDKF